MRFLGLGMLLLAGCSGAPDDDQPLQVTDVAFATPESVLHDAVADVYLVSNINGAPYAEDDNGFISRLRPDGTVEQLTWINGADADVELDAPKGMAIIGDTLFVADISLVRKFHRETGAPLGGLAVPGATFLNDLAAGDGALYITDSGLEAGPEGLAPSGSDAIWRWREGELVPLARTPDLGAPNGIVPTERGIVVVTFGSGQVYRLAAGGERVPVASPAGGQLDGVVALDDGALLVSSWGAQAVYHIDADGLTHIVVDSVSSPADIGWDATRERVLIPVFTEHRVVIHPLD